MTVASFATISTSRPDTRPTPVTMPAAGRSVVVQVPGRQRGELEKRRAVVQQLLNPIARRQLALLAMPLDVLRAAPLLHEGDALAEARPRAPSCGRDWCGRGPRSGRRESRGCPSVELPSPESRVPSPRRSTLTTRSSPSCSGSSGSATRRAFGTSRRRTARRSRRRRPEQVTAIGPRRRRRRRSAVCPVRPWWRIIGHVGFAPAGLVGQLSTGRGVEPQRDGSRPRTRSEHRMDDGRP